LTTSGWLDSAVAEAAAPAADEKGSSNGSVEPGTPRPPKGEELEVYVRGRRVEPKTEGQRDYLEAIRKHDLVFCCGPAGTGKTFLAVAAAVAMLKQGLVRKLVLVRPAVEAGERLGFLPGDMQQKVNPYLRPLLDALHDMMPFEQVQRFMHSDLIEIVPLAFMRGRTLNEAAVILDEAQNTTRSQMLMFLTRLGHGSKMIVTGDTSQTDLEDGQESGLVDAIRRLRQVPGVAFQTLTRQDIVRHQLVHQIVQAYGREPNQNAANAD
jgi:phosphate starvation-inducible PhoH-like protein